MRFLLRAATLGGVVAMLISASTSVSAGGGGAGNAVFVETNGTTGNGSSPITGRTMAL